MRGRLRGYKQVFSEQREKKVVRGSTQSLCLKVFLSFRVYNYMKTEDGEDSFDLLSFGGEKIKMGINISLTSRSAVCGLFITQIFFLQNFVSM